MVRIFLTSSMIRSGGHPGRACGRPLPGGARLVVTLALTLLSTGASGDLSRVLVGDIPPSAGVGDLVPLDLPAVDQDEVVLGAGHLGLLA